MYGVGSHHVCVYIFHCNLHIAEHNQFQDNKQSGTQKCEKKCVICKYMKVGTLHKSLSGKEFVFNDKIDCRTNNLIYGIYCDKCGAIVYVGETGTTLYERFQNHISSINHEKDEPIPRHFNQEDHSLHHFKIIGIEKNRRKDILLSFPSCPKRPLFLLFEARPNHL